MLVHALVWMVRHCLPHWLVGQIGLLLTLSQVPESYMFVPTGPSVEVAFLPALRILSQVLRSPILFCGALKGLFGFVGFQY